MIEETLECISYVSASGNGNSVPPRCVDNHELLWVRFCDRLEAIGTVGAIRCYQYNLEKGEKLSCDTTPRPKTIQEVWNEVKPEKFEKY